MINQKSIAILPFYNTSESAENQYFADGISEEIINTLSKIAGLKVISRTSSFSYRNTSLDIRHIGNELGVSTVLEGSVRRSGSRVRITSQLIRTDTGFQIWSEKFDRHLEDIFDLQEEISKHIAERIRENFGHFFIQDDLLSSRTNHADAYSKYLEGRHYQLKGTQADLQAAMQEYKASIAMDPDFPMAYLGLSQCFIYLSSGNFIDRMKGMFMAYHFLSKVGTNGEHIPEYHFTKGLFHYLGKWEFATAERYFLKAITLNPNYSEAMQMMANVQITVGRFKEAHTFIERALHLDPNAENNHFTKASILYFSGDYGMALSYLKQIRAFNGDLHRAWRLRALSAIMAKDTREFTDAINQLDEHSAVPFNALWNLLIGKSDEVVNTEWDDPYFPMKLYLLVTKGKTSEALHTLEDGVIARDARYIYCLFDPLFYSLISTDSYQRIKTLILPQGKSTIKKSIAEPQLKEKMPQSEIDYFQKALESLIKTDSPHLDTNLTLKTLAEKINLHPNKLSWLLNEKLGKNFNDFINGYRLKAFQEKAVDPANSHLTLLGLAYESGFTSKSVFNDFFKRNTGLTPKAWVKKCARK